MSSSWPTKWPLRQSTVMLMPSAKPLPAEEPLGVFAGVPQAPHSSAKARISAGIILFLT